MHHHNGENSIWKELCRELRVWRSWNFFWVLSILALLFVAVVFTSWVVCRLVKDAARFYEDEQRWIREDERNRRIREQAPITTFVPRRPLAVISVVRNGVLRNSEEEAGASETTQVSDTRPLNIFERIRRDNLFNNSVITTYKQLKNKKINNDTEKSEENSENLDGISIESYRTSLGSSSDSDNISLKSTESEKSECPICLSRYEEEETIRKLGCEHYYHAACIDRWILNEETCPNCRRHVREPNEASVQYYYF